jgi:hypothetical protein
MKTKIVLIAFALLAGCGEYNTGESAAAGAMRNTTPTSEKVIAVQIGKTSNSRIERFHDDEMNATCWIIDGYRQFQCIPDTMLVKHKGMVAQ